MLAELHPDLEIDTTHATVCTVERSERMRTQSYEMYVSYSRTLSADPCSNYMVMGLRGKTKDRDMNLVFWNDKYWLLRFQVSDDHRTIQPTGNIILTPAFS